MSNLELSRLAKAVDRLGEAVIDPTVWPDLMEDICTGVGARGAALLQSDNRTPDVPYTTELEELVSGYFGGGWHTKDIWADRSVPLLAAGRPVVLDTDILRPADIAHDPFSNECRTPLGFSWYAAIGVKAGNAYWGLTIHRTAAEGMFSETERQILAPLSQKLTEVASLSTAVGRIALSSVVNAMEHVQRAAIAIDRFGNVLDTNAAAQRAFDDEFYIRQRRIIVKDELASARFENLFDRLRTAQDKDAIAFDPIVIRSTAGKPIVVRLMPVHPAANSPFLGARALLVFSPPAAQKAIQPAVLMQAFKLTGAEARLAAELAEGASLDAITQKFGTTRETVRNQLKTVFSKTGTHRQAELVSLLNQFKD
jgi:DNA-binding CsgD family transcriptional regulator